MTTRRKSKCVFCGEPVVARSLCNKHYRYIRNHNGDFNNMEECLRLLRFHYGEPSQSPVCKPKRNITRKKRKPAEKPTSCFYCGKPLYKGKLCKNHYLTVKVNYCDYKDYVRAIASYEYGLIHNREERCIICGKPTTSHNLCYIHKAYVKRGIDRGITMQDSIYHMLETHFDETNVCLICGKPANIYNLCEEHFNFARNRQLDYNDVNTIAHEYNTQKKSVVNMKPLSKGGCAFCHRQVYAHGFCKLHNTTLIKQGANLEDKQECLNLLQALAFKKQKRCAICGDKVYVMGLCKEHNSLAYDNKINRTDLLQLIRLIKHRQANKQIRRD